MDRSGHARSGRAIVSIVGFDRVVGVLLLVGEVADPRGCNELPRLFGGRSIEDVWIPTMVTNDLPGSLLVRRDQIDGFFLPVRLSNLDEIGLHHGDMGCWRSLHFHLLAWLNLGRGR